MVGQRSFAAESVAAATPPTTAPATQPDGAEPKRFYGPVSAVDLKAKTLVVDNKNVPAIVAETQTTYAADGSPATLADAVVGQPARGTFVRTVDGKLNVTKLRFGRKAAGGKPGGGKNKPAVRPGAGAAATQPG